MAKRMETRTIEDFEVQDVLGEGAYAVVYRAVERVNGQVCAIKQLSKGHIIKEKKVESIKREKYILSKLKGKTGIVTLLYTFQDQSNLYFVLEHLPKGDLVDVLKRVGPLSLECVRFYAAQIVVILETLRSANVAHRDLKPENLMLNQNNHLKLIDFGTAIQFDNAKGKSREFVGTLEFLPPELLQRDKSSGMYGDLWALGCVIYQLLFGQPAFRGDSEWLTFNLIKARDFVFPEEYPNKAATSLINSLLVPRPELRLGAGPAGLRELKAHEFFAGVDWDHLFEAEAPPLVRTDIPIMFPAKEQAREEAGAEKEAKEEEEEASREEVHAKTLSTELGSSYRITEPGADTTSVNFDAEELKQKRMQTIRMQKSIIWSKWLIPDSEMIVEMGLVFKKKGLFPRKRQLVLTDLPRLFYIDPEKMLQKGEIPWSDDIFTDVKSKTHFNIVTPKRTYILEDCQQNPFRWGESIELVKSLVNARQLLSSKKS
mmetsp:Transcript_8401/g.35143  ORF Transcript_8401/g.35143 Transcript_8401/m.35143 type:complete len:486 (+) Transcript_8401:160-1617(+)